MITPFRFDDLFKINLDSQIIIENGSIIIDNFFLHFDDVSNYVYNNNVEIWKYNSVSRNFIDYYDCRHAINNFWVEFAEFDKTIVSLIKNCLGFDVTPTSKRVEFNYFKNLKLGVPNHLQHYPHKDFAFNLLVYLDNQLNGGTAIYNTEKHIENNETDNLLYDVSGLDKTIIQAKPNRCVIFDGNQYHGGHIDNHDVYYDNWRINLVRFYECILPGS